MDGEFPRGSGDGQVVDGVQQRSANLMAGSRRSVASWGSSEERLE
jgi:hypothetical protein